LAALDVAGPTAPEERLKLADAWLELVRSRPELGATELSRRAGHWYRQARDGELSAINKERVDKQLKLVAEQLPPSRPIHVGSELHRLVGHKVAVTCVTYLFDGAHLLSASDDGSIRLWDTTTGTEEKTYRTPRDTTVAGLAM